MDGNVKPSPIDRGVSAGKERSELYMVVFKGLPLHRKTLRFGNQRETTSSFEGLDIPKLSNDIGVSKQKISAWFKDDKLPGGRVTAFIELEGSTLTYEDLGPFITSR